MKFFEFCQNNSGGNFHYDSAGITHLVIIEASDKDDACSRAEGIGIYFDGCDTGRDCACCGDRWSRPYDDGDDVPSHYGEPIKDETIDVRIAWMKPNPEGVIHYADGRIVWVKAA